MTKSPIGACEVLLYELEWQTPLLTAVLQVVLSIAPEIQLKFRNSFFEVVEELQLQGVNV